MNQRRVSIATPLVAIATLVSGGLVLGMLLHQTNPLFLSLLLVFFIGVGIWSLATMHRSANAWSWNVTPATFQRLPRGSWDIVAISLNRGTSDGYVYVTIAELPINSDCPVRTALSTIALQPHFIEITDYKSIVEGAKPLRIAISHKDIRFLWPQKGTGIQMQI